MQFLDGSHYEVRLTRIEHDTIRLWIEVGATFYGNYRAYDRWPEQMARYGVTPRKDEQGAVDPFATEQEYWESFWWPPQ